FSGGSVDIDRSAMLLDDDVMADRQAQPCPFARRFGGEERVEHALPHLGWNAVAIVTNPDLDAVPEVFRRSRQRGFVATCSSLRLALISRIEPVGNQVEEYPRDLLWKEIGLACRRVERPLQRDVETLLFGPGAVICEIKAFLHYGIDIYRPVLAGPLARVKQHVLDDRIGALAVLHDLL